MFLINRRNDIPCGDSNCEREHITRYASGISPETLKHTKESLVEVTAMLCALINALDKKGIAAQVIAEASRDGLVDIMSFWEKHKTDDRSRLESQLHKNYSIDEQNVLREILNSK